MVVPRFYFKIALPLLVMFIGITGLLYARSSPYDDHELRALLTPDGCPAPCVLGIRPGVTTANDAVQILQNNPWVKDVKINRNGAGVIVSVQWDWNGSQPDVIPVQSPAYILFSMSDEGSVFIDKITVTTTVPVGYAYLVMGQPDSLQSWPTGTVAIALVGAVYDDQRLTVWSTVPCPMNKLTFWEAPMTVDFFSRRSQFDIMAHANASAYC